MKELAEVALVISGLGRCYREEMARDAYLSFLCLLSNDSKLGETKKSGLEVWLSDRVLS